MQFKPYFFVTLATLAAAQCDTGPVQCCDSMQSASTPSVANILGGLGIGAQGVTGLVGITCNPITDKGLGGNSCATQPVCCTNNNFNGIVALGCTPVDVNF